MKKFIFSQIIFFLFFCTGCNSIPEPNTKLKFYTPSKINVIKQGSLVLITSKVNVGYKNQKSLIESVASKINMSNYFEAITEIGSRSPDYIININNFVAYRVDQGIEKEYNKAFNVARKVKRDSNGNETGGYEYITETNQYSSISSFISCVYIYETKIFEPQMYFKIITTGTDWNSWNKDVTSRDEFVRSLSSNIVNKIEDMLIIDYKYVGIIFPSSANEKIKSMMLGEKYSFAATEIKGMIPYLFDIIEKDPYDIVSQYTKWQEESEKNKTSPKSISNDMNLYYLYLLCNEANNLDIETIKAVHDGLTKILYITDENDLISACAHSLGRVEVKGNRLFPGTF